MLKNGIRVILAHNYNSKLRSNYKDRKFISFPFLSQVPEFSGDGIYLRIFRDSNELADILSYDKIDVVFSLHSRSFYGISAKNVKWFCLQHGFDSFYEPDLDCDGLFVYSKLWLSGDVGRKLLDSGHQANIIESGAFHLDRKYILLEDNEIKRKYNISTNKKIVVVFPIDHPFCYPFGFIKNMFFLQLKYASAEKKMLQALKNWADTNDYCLVIKSRFKRLVPFYEEYGTVLYDETFYPATVHEILSISDIVIGTFYSTVVTEAVYFKNKYIHLTLTEMDNDFKKYPLTKIHYHYFNEFFMPDGLVFHYDIRKFLNSIPQELTRLSKHQFDEIKQSEYIKKFLCPFSGDSPVERIIKFLSNV
jgi:hypothetical protein